MSSKPVSVVGRSRRGEFNVLWLVVTLVGIVMALAIMYLIYGGVNSRWAQPMRR